MEMVLMRAEACHMTKTVITALLIFSLHIFTLILIYLQIKNDMNLYQPAYKRIPTHVVPYKM